MRRTWVKQRGICVSEENVPEDDEDEDGKGREQRGHHDEGAFADGLCAAEVPCGGERDDGEFPEKSAMAGGERGREAREIGDEDGGVDGHVKDAGGKREPGLLKTPEAAERASHPDVVAAFGGDGGGKLADHEGGGQAPEERDDEEQKERAAVAGVAEDVLEAIGAAGDHEVGGRDERKETHFAGAVTHGLEGWRENLPQMSNVTELGEDMRS